MSDDNHQEKTQEKTQEKKPRESTEEFCTRLGIKRIREQRGMEFCPWHGPRKAPISEQVS
jgi:hypothetical protein